MACTHGQRRKRRRQRQEAHASCFSLLFFLDATFSCAMMLWQEKDLESGTTDRRCVDVFLSFVPFLFFIIEFHFLFPLFCFTFSVNVFRLNPISSSRLCASRLPWEKYRRNDTIEVLSVCPYPRLLFSFLSLVSNFPPQNPHCAHHTQIEPDCLMYSPADLHSYCHDMPHTSTNTVLVFFLNVSLSDGSL